MSEKSNGGPAFPSEAMVHDVPSGEHRWLLHDGMTLRDYFAAKALMGMIASSPVCNRTDAKQVNKPRWAAQAYEFADAMLKERDK